MNNFDIDLADSLSSINDNKDNQNKEDLEFDNLFQHLEFSDQNDSQNSNNDNEFKLYDKDSFGFVDSIELIKEAYQKQKKQNLSQQIQQLEVDYLVGADLNKIQDGSPTFGGKNKQKQQQVKQKMKFICEYCKKEFQLLELEKHKEICESRLEIDYQEINCPYCGDQIIRAFIKDHFEECIAYIEDNFKKIDNITECSICMGEMQFKEIKLKCEHEFHKDCITEWLKKKQECPVCRMKVQM